jgi:hypothetical protein
MKEIPTPMEFKQFTLPEGQVESVPTDITLELPQESDLPLDQQHFLIYIPWEDRYVDQVDLEYRPFFEHVLHNLSSCTSI